MRSVFALAVLVAAGPALAQRTSPLTIEQITQRPEDWIGAWPSEPYWTEAGDAVYFEWNPDGQFPADSLFRIDPAGGTPEEFDAFIASETAKWGAVIRTAGVKAE